MFVRMVRRSIVRGWRKKALAAAMVAIGTSLAVGMLTVALNIGDKVNRELKSYGANILVRPEAEMVTPGVEGAEYTPLAVQSYLREEDLPNLKAIFWRNNIMGFAPSLEARAHASNGEQVEVVGTWFRKTLVIPTGETVSTGVRDIKPWWQVEGSWPEDEATRPGVLVGKALAQRLSLETGEDLTLLFPGGRKHELKVAGIVSAGGEEDKQAFVTLGWLQQATGLQGKVSQVEVSALTMPNNDLARKAEKHGVDSLSREEFDTWYCSPYVDSVAYQIEEVMPGARARPVRQVAESEGAILSKVTLLMSLVALGAVITSTLGISSLIGAAALERSKELGLLKALGAHNSSVTWLFLADSVILGIVGGAVGLMMGTVLARFIANSVFSSSLDSGLFAATPAAFAISVGMALLGSLSAVRTIAGLQPSQILAGR